MKNRINYIESKLPKEVKDFNGNIVTIEEKYARYEGNGVYQWKGLRTTDTAELFLIGVLKSENISFSGM